MEERIRAVLEKKAAASELTAPPAVQDTPWASVADQAPELPTSKSFTQSEADKLIDQAVTSLDILDAYSKYIGKMTPRVGNKTEGIKISCPMPNHPDKDPSAWISTDKQTWYCGGCDIGGDALDLAAISKGYSLQEIRSAGSGFGDLRKEIAQDMGVVIERDSSTGETTAWKPVAVADIEKYSPPEIPAAPAAPVTPEQLQVANEPSKNSEPEQAEEFVMPPLNWRGIVTPGTFLHEYMTQVINDDVPEEYHFWHGMLALSVICGQQVHLHDGPPVSSNLFVCLLGSTGSGKSKAKVYLTKVLREAAPYTSNPQMPSSGVKLVPTPGSGEAMIKEFSAPIQDNPSSPKLITGYSSVRGVVEFSEFRLFVSKAEAKGSSFTSRLIEFYDCAPVIENSTVVSGHSYAEKPHAVVLSTVQPELLKELLSKEDTNQGFVNRWTFVGGPKKKKQLFNLVQPDMTQAVTLLKDIHQWSYSPKTVFFSPEAAEMFEKAWYGYIEADQRRHPLILTRIDLFIKKLSLLFCINEKTELVTAEIFQKVLDMYPYLIQCIELQSRAMAGRSVATEFEDAIIDCLDKKGPGTASAIRKKLPRKFRVLDATLLVRALDALVKSDTITYAPTPNSLGRPSKIYMLQSHADGTHPVPNSPSAPSTTGTPETNTSGDQS